MSSYSFEVRGIPKPQPRGRAVTRKGGHAGIVDPGTSDYWKALVREASRPVKPREPLAGPLQVAIWFRFDRPNAHYGKKGLKPKAPAHHTQRPDVDNLAKAVLDAMTNEAWWGDDDQICLLTITKAWGTVEDRGATVAVTEV